MCPDSPTSQSQDTVLTNPKKKSFTHQKRTGYTKPISSSIGGQGNGQKKRYGKPSKPQAPRRAPVKEYISVCCGVPARKPVAGKKVMQENPESHKVKETAKGLGKWRCGQCGKAAKVTPRVPQNTILSGSESGTTPLPVFRSLPTLPQSASLGEPSLGLGQAEVQINDQPILY
jgi:hypothetical protein